MGLYGTPRSRRSVRRGSDGSALAGLASGLWALCLIAGLGFLVWFVIKTMTEKSQEQVKESARKSNPLTAPIPAPAPGHAAASAPAAPLKPSEARLLTDLNIAVVAKEIARYRGQSTGRGAEIAQSQFEAAAAEATLAAQQYLEALDEFLAVDEVDLTKMSKGEAADFMAGRFERVGQGTLVRFRLMRGGGSREVIAHFVLTTGLGEARANSDKIKIPPELAQEIQQKFWGIGQYYQATYYTPEERDMVEKVLGRGEANAEEWAFLSKRVLRGAVQAEVQTEQDWFRTRLKALEGQMASAQIPDYLVQKDGKRLEGKFVEQADKYVKIETAYGRVTIYREDIKDVFGTKEIRAEFEQKLKGAKDHPEAYPEILTWAREMNLPAHREYVAYLMLLRSPSDRVARLAAGYSQGASGKWELPGGAGPSSADAPVAQRPGIKLPDNRKEMKVRLEELGFVQKGERWFARMPWSTGLDTLYKSGDVRYTLQGVALMDAKEGESPLAVFSNARVSGSGIREKFLCPVGPNGSVALTISAPGEIDECKVKARGSVVSSLEVDRDNMGRVAVYVVADGGKQVPLYSITRGGNDDAFDVTEQVKGKRNFSVVAQLSTTADKFHTYARFLPSVPDSRQTFWVSGHVLQPAPDIDRTWAAAK